MNKVSISTLALVAILGAGLVGCTDDDVSYGGYVASGGVIYGDNFHDHNFPYPGYYTGPIHGGGGFHGGHDGGGFHGGGDHGPGPGGFGGGHPGGGFGGGMHGGGGFGGGHGGHPIALVTNDAALSNAFNEISASAPATVTFQSTDARVQHVAAQYSISDYAATYVVRAIVMAQTKDMTGLQAMGLDTNDFSDLYNGRELSSDKIYTLATTLKMPTVAAQALIQDMSSDIQAQQKKMNN